LIKSVKQSKSISISRLPSIFSILISLGFQSWFLQSICRIQYSIPLTTPSRCSNKAKLVKWLHKHTVLLDDECSSSSSQPCVDHCPYDSFVVLECKDQRLPRGFDFVSLIFIILQFSGPFYLNSQLSWLQPLERSHNSANLFNYLVEYHEFSLMKTVLSLQLDKRPIRSLTQANILKIELPIINFCLIFINYYSLTI
jgi:hypothetical protein